MSAKGLTVEIDIRLSEESRRQLAQIRLLLSQLGFAIDNYLSAHQPLDEASGDTLPDTREVMR